MVNVRSKQIITEEIIIEKTKATVGTDANIHMKYRNAQNTIDKLNKKLRDKKSVNLSEDFWDAWKDVKESLESAWAKWPSKLVSWGIIKRAVEGLR